MPCNLKIVLFDLTHTFIKVYVDRDVTVYTVSQTRNLGVIFDPSESSFFYLLVDLIAPTDSWCSCWWKEQPGPAFYHIQSCCWIWVDCNGEGKKTGEGAIPDRGTCINKCLGLKVERIVGGGVVVRPEYPEHTHKMFMELIGFGTFSGKHYGVIY